MTEEQANNILLADLEKEKIAVEIRRYDTRIRLAKKELDRLCKERRGLYFLYNTRGNPNFPINDLTFEERCGRLEA